MSCSFFMTRIGIASFVSNLLCVEIMTQQTLEGRCFFFPRHSNIKYPSNALLVNLKRPFNRSLVILVCTPRGLESLIFHTQLGLVRTVAIHVTMTFGGRSP